MRYTYHVLTLTHRVVDKCRASEGMDKAGKDQMCLLTLRLQYKASAKTDMHTLTYNRKEVRTFLSGACAWQSGVRSEITSEFSHGLFFI